eukprot:gene8810-8621_t
MTSPDFDTFSSTAKASGFDEVLERRWEANTWLDTHTHPFDVQALVTEGEFWLTVDGQTRHLRPGDAFHLARNVAHAERYGPQGATYWYWVHGSALGLGLMGAQLVQAVPLGQESIKQAIQSGQLEQALKLVQQERQANPKEVQFQFMEGVIQAQQGQTDKAIETFKKITETHPELSEAYNNLGVLFAAKGRLEESRNFLEKALQTHPSYAAAHRNLSDVHSQLAKQSYAKALQADPKAKISAPQLTLLGSIGPDKRSPVSASSLPATTPGVAPVVAPVVATAPVATQASSVMPAKPSPTASTAAPAQPKAAPSAVAAPAKQAAPATAPQATPAAAVPVAVKNSPAAKTEEAEVRAAVQAWAKAWSQKDMPRYFAAYTSTFTGAERQPRAKWESDRQVRIVSKKSISVVANNLKIDVDGNKATAQFQQIYESDNFKGNSRKTLEMQRRRRAAPYALAWSKLLRWVVPSLLVSALALAAWWVAARHGGPDATIELTNAQATSGPMRWRIEFEPGPEQPAAASPDPETLVRRIYAQLGQGERSQALATAASLAAQFPNFQLGQLLYADLLNISSRQPIHGEEIDEETRPSALKRLEELVLEAKRRLSPPEAHTLHGQIPAALTYIDPQQAYVAAVDASRSRLYWFANRTGHDGKPRLELLKETYVSVGINGVGKLKEGDGKTPLGVYFIQKNLPGATLPDLFGVGALTLNYPSAIDI